MPKRPDSRKQRLPANEVVRYVLEISDWDWNFSFGVNSSKHDADPYWDFRHLQISGLLVRPRKLGAESAELSFLPNSKLNEKHRQSDPSMVGFFQLHKKRLTGIISMPSDVLGPVLQMLVGSRFRYIELSGDKLRYGKANLRSYRFETIISDNDMPDE